MTTDTETTTSFSGFDRLLADIKLCKQELRETKVEEMDFEQFKKWTKDQLLHTQMTLVEQLAKAIAEELTEITAEMINMGEAIQNIIDEDGSFLTPELANDLKATFALGMAITGILESEKVTLENDLKNKQLQAAVKLFKN